MGYIKKFAIISRKNQIYQENSGGYQEILCFIKKNQDISRKSPILSIADPSHPLTNYPNTSKWNIRTKQGIIGTYLKNLWLGGTNVE